MNLVRPLKASKAEPTLQASAPVVELRGVGLRTVARDAAVALAPGHDLGNVVPFSRARRDGADRAAPAVVVAPEDRAGASAGRRAKLWTAFLLCSVAIHGGIYFFFHDNAPPMASIGLESISVDLVLGANMAAGLTPDKGEAEASAPTPAMTPEPTPEALPDPEAVEAAKPDELAQATPPEPTRSEAAPPEKTEAAAAAPVAPVTPVPDEPPTPAPVQAIPSPAPAEAELQASINPQKPIEPVETRNYETAAAPRKPEPKVAKPAEDKRETERRERERERREQARREQAKREHAKREEAREKRRAALAGQRNNSRSTSAASTAAGGVGRGRSELTSNYRGIVAAHLARYKQFPAEARASGQTGTASVTFSLSGSGGVTSSRLARSSGVPSLDREVTAMVRRASPFPPPPDGRPVSFTVPINFQVR